MVIKRIIYLIFTGIFISSSCEKFPYDKKALTYKNMFVFDNQFRMDGIYTWKRYSDKNIYYYMYFFKNGICCDIGIEKPDEYFFTECIEIWPNARNLPYFWGCFIVEDNILKIQTFDAASLNYSTKYRVVEQWAEIVNDTTLHFFKGIDSKGKSSKLDKTFHFRHCENKPDSMNILMRD